MESTASESGTKDFEHNCLYLLVSNLTFLSYAGKPSDRSFTLDKMSEEDDDAYDFKTDYV